MLPVNLLIVDECLQVYVGTLIRFQYCTTELNDLQSSNLLSDFGQGMPPLWASVSLIYNTKMIIPASLGSEGYIGIHL